eukprot:jgi/Ulvmu1/5056/UM021_0073.1
MALRLSTCCLARTLGPAVRGFRAIPGTLGLSETAPAADTSISLEEFRQHVSDFANRTIAPHAAEIDTHNTFPTSVDLWTEMGAMGLHGVTVPERYGGLGLGYLHHVIAMEEISRCSGSVALSYGAHSNLCVSQLVRHGTEAQLEKYLPALLSGESIGALSMTEANSGSDVVSLRTTAIRHGDKFLLNGSKMWCTNGPTASTIIVYAKTDPTAAKHGITAFILEAGMPGLSSAQKLDKLGMRGSDTCELVLDNVEVPLENVLGEVNKGVYVLMSGLDYERLVLSGGPIGIMQACMDTVLPYVRERSQFGKPIGSFQLIQAKLADMYVALEASRALSYRTAEALDSGKLAPKDCAAAILHAAEHATQCSLQAIQILGGNGYVNDYCTGRLLRDAKLYEIGAGTSEVRRLIIGKGLYRDMLAQS